MLSSVCTGTTASAQSLGCKMKPLYIVIIAICVSVWITSHFKDVSGRIVGKRFDIFCHLLCGSIQSSSVFYVGQDDSGWNNCEVYGGIQEALRFVGEDRENAVSITAKPTIFDTLRGELYFRFHRDSSTTKNNVSGAIMVRIFGGRIDHLQAENSSLTWRGWTRPIFLKFERDKTSISSIILER